MSKKETYEGVEITVCEPKTSADQVVIKKGKFNNRVSYRPEQQQDKYARNLNKDQNLCED